MVAPAVAIVNIAVVPSYAPAEVGVAVSATAVLTCNLNFQLSIRYKTVGSGPKSTVLGHIGQSRGIKLDGPID